MPADLKSNAGRDEFAFASGQVFLNHAAFGPTPRRARRDGDRLDDRLGRLQSGDNVDAETYDLLAGTKKMFGRLIGQNSRRIAFVPNTSHGLNMTLWGLNLRRGERILIAAVEFPAVVYAALNIARQRHLTVEHLPCPEGYLTMETLQKALRRKTAVLAISWVQYFNGYRYDLAAISELCHAAGCFVLVDGIQGIGAVPMTMRRWGLDAVACGGQKWLLSQTGSGFFALADDPIRAVDPPFAGWLSHDWRYRFGNLQRRDRPRYADGRRWEVGTYSHQSVRNAHAGLGLLCEAGIGRVFQRIDKLTERLAIGLSGSLYRVNRFPARVNRSGIITIGGPGTAQLQKHLRVRGFHTALREGNIRVAPHFYNTDDEIDAFVEEIWHFEQNRKRSVRRAGRSRTTAR